MYKSLIKTRQCIHNMPCTDPFQFVMKPFHRTVPLASQVQITHQHLGRCIATVHIPTNNYRCTSIVSSEISIVNFQEIC